MDGRLADAIDARLDARHSGRVFCRLSKRGRNLCARQNCRQPDAALPHLRHSCFPRHIPPPLLDSPFVYMSVEHIQNRQRHLGKFEKLLRASWKVQVSDFWLCSYPIEQPRLSSQSLTRGLMHPAMSTYIDEFLSPTFQSTGHP